MYTSLITRYPSVIPGLDRLTQAAVCADWHRNYTILKVRMIELGYTWWETYHTLSQIRDACPF